MFSFWTPFDTLDRKIREGIDSGVSPICFSAAKYPNLEAGVAQFAARAPDFDVSLTRDDNGVATVHYDRREPGTSPVFCTLVEMMHRGEKSRCVDKRVGSHIEAVRMFNEKFPDYEASREVEDMGSWDWYSLRVEKRR